MNDDNRFHEEEIHCRRRGLTKTNVRDFVGVTQPRQAFDGEHV